VILAAVALGGHREITYCSDWLGYLPFGVYQWVECGGVEVREVPSGWSGEDLAALEAAGVLEKTGEWRNPADEYESKVTYRVRA
jgi:hypothetical protein